MRSFPWQNLIEWYTNNGRHTLPWRQVFDMPWKERWYRIWLSEIMLQQTQVSRVQDYYQNIVSYFPDIYSLSKSSWDAFFPYYEGLWYYRRGHNMLACAREVCHVYDGMFPNNYTSLISLPGIGPYTARAILAFAYNKPVLAYDTNLEKVFARYYYGSKHAKLSTQDKQIIQNDFVASGYQAREINAALMDFASMVSLKNPDNIDFANYPLPGCRFGQSKWTKEPKPNISTAKFPYKNAYLILVLHKDHKIYYSAHTDTYTPFILPPTNQDPRSYAKAYFLYNYGLWVSVRPIHKTGYDQNNQAYKIANAQIQRGVNEFAEFSRNDITDPHFITV